MHDLDASNRALWAEVKAVRAENDRLHADYETRGADLEALMTRCERAEAMLSVAVVRGNEYHAAIARVRELCAHAVDPRFIGPSAICPTDILAALDGVE